MRLFFSAWFRIDATNVLLRVRISSFFHVFLCLTTLDRLSATANGELVLTDGPALARAGANASPAIWHRTQKQRGAHNMGAAVP